ncbi:hypothetical protein BY996DRAFT_6431870 [Phakopsora pachyrhizi]|nr:hypothetical protein BY996DRAFT_6431870 [Phakopsora pachyrhizi]
MFLRRISNFLEFISKPIHESMVPIPIIPIIHAARISAIYRSLRNTAGGKTSFTADLAGFLLMSWGGSIVSCILLGLPMPQLLSFTPILVYSSIHLAMPSFKHLPTAKTLDTILPLLDALIKTSTVAAGVDMCRNHEKRIVAESLSIQLFIGAISASGGGILSQTMSVWEPSWRLCRPHFLQEGSILAGTDVWSGALTAGIYGYLTSSHPFYTRSKPDSSSAYSDLEAKTLAACFLTLILLWKAYKTHHSPALVVNSYKSQKKNSQKERNMSCLGI